MAVFGARSGTWSREQGSQDATILGPGPGPRACCLSLSSGPTASCSMPEFPCLYRAVRARCVSTHNRCVRPCTSPRGHPQPRVLTKETQPWRARRQPLISQTGRCQGGHRTNRGRCPVPRGWPREVPSVLGLESQILVHSPGRDPTCCLEGSFCPRVCHLLPTPCAPRRQRACQPWSLCVPSIQPGAQHALGVQSVSSVGTASVCTFFSGLYTAGSGSAGAARAARCPAWDLLSQPGPGLCAGDPAPVTWSRLTEPTRLHIP